VRGSLRGILDIWHLLVNSPGDFLSLSMPLLRSSMTRACSVSGVVGHVLDDWEISAVRRSGRVTAQRHLDRRLRPGYLSWLKPGGMMTLKLAYLENPLVAPSDAGRKPFPTCVRLAPSSPAKAPKPMVAANWMMANTAAGNNQPGGHFGGDPLHLRVHALAFEFLATSRA